MREVRFGSKYFFLTFQQTPKQGKKTGKKQKEIKAKPIERKGSNPVDKVDDTQKKTKAELKAERRALQVIYFTNSTPFNY